MSGSNRGKKRGKIKIAKEKTMISAGNENNDYEETLKDEKNLEVPFVHIEIETVGDMSNDNQQLPPREQISIEEIVKSILRSIDLLIKYDPDNLRSTNVRVKIITALFCYHDLVDNKILNFSMYKDTGELTNNYYCPSEDNIETVTCDYETKNDNINETDSREVEFATIDEESMSIKRLKDKIKNKQLMEECSSPKQLKKEPFSNVKKLIAWFKKKNIHRSKRKFRRSNIDGVKLKRRIRTSVENKIYVPETTDSFDEGDISIKEEVPLDLEPLKSTLPRFVCDMCDVSLVSEHHLAVHKMLCRRRLFYYGNPKLEEFWNDIKCPLCDVKCNHRGNLGRHYITHRVKDIEIAFATIKDKDLNMNNPENNMKLLNDFITEFEKADEKGIQMASSDKSNHEDETANLENKKTTKKISDYLKFNVKKIVYDIDFDKDHYCYTCDLVFKDKEELERHKMKINDTDAFICNHCDKTFDMPIKLIHHTKTHSGLYNPQSLYLSFKEDSEGCPTQLDYKIYVCKYCLAMFVQSVSLQSHMNYYNKHRECCSKKYKSPRGTTAKRTPPGVQKTEDGKLKCDKCEKTYGNYSVFLRHSKSHAEHSKYFCECGKGFKSKERLKFHINLVHNRKFQVICEICGLNVLHHNLRRHKRVHSSLKPFKCNYCNKTFKYKGSVTTHIRIHTQEKPWQCQYCGVAFSEKRRYDIHINVHEGKTPFKCQLCPSAFVSKLKLNKHVLEHQDCRL